MEVNAIMWDIDGTILDFLKAEEAAINSLFEKFEFGTCTDEMLHRYSIINKKYWERLERNEITKDEVLVGRFEEFFSNEKLDVSKAREFNKEYQIALGDTIVFRDQCKDLLLSLKGKVFQFAVTNGTKIAQDKKLKNSGLDIIFDEIFISEEVGYEKPNIEFFNEVFNTIEMRGYSISKDKIILIGDSLTSDMKGANNANITNVWYNPKHSINNSDSKIDYEVDNIWKIREIFDL